MDGCGTPDVLHSHRKAKGAKGGVKRVVGNAPELYRRPLHPHIDPCAKSICSMCFRSVLKCFMVRLEPQWPSQPTGPTMSNLSICSPKMDVGPMLWHEKYESSDLPNIWVLGGACWISLADLSSMGESDSTWLGPNMSDITDWHKVIPSELPVRWHVTNLS